MKKERKTKQAMQNKQYTANKTKQIKTNGKESKTKR